LPPSSPPFPKPLFPLKCPSSLLPLPPECAIAVELSEVDSGSVMAGEVTTANFPHVSKKTSADLDRHLAQSIVRFLLRLTHLEPSIPQ
jgi:hypothetical protein